MRIIFNNRGFDVYSYHEEMFSSLPNYSGLYIFRILTKGQKAKKIKYIGSTKYLLIRIKPHLVLRKLRKELQDGQSIEILFSFCGCIFKAREVEKQFIRKYKPQYNKHYTKKI